MTEDGVPAPPERPGTPAERLPSDRAERHAFGDEEALGERPPPRDSRELALRVTYRQAPLASAVSVLIASLLCYALRDLVAGRRLALFFAAVFAAALLRLVLALAFQRRARDAPGRRWSLAFDVTLVVSSLVWGLGAVAVLPRDSPLHQAMIYLFAVGMAAGTAVMYVSARRAAIASGLAFLVPLIVVFGLKDDEAFRILALAGVAYLVLTVRGIATLGAFVTRSFQLTDELARARREAEVLARTDPLTGLLNRRAFYEMGRYLVEQARRHERALSILVLDVDEFKSINDQHGHAAGDAALRAVARLLVQSGRRIDVVGRLGGDELAMLLPDTTADEAHGIAERVRSALAGLRVHEGGAAIATTCSIGVAGWTTKGNLDELVSRADFALYRAKESGRDRVVRAD